MGMFGTDSKDELFDEVLEFLDNNEGDVEELLRIVGYAIDIHIRNTQNKDNSCTN